MSNCLIVPVHIDGLYLTEDTLMTEPSVDFARLPFFNSQRDINADVANISENFVAPPLQNQNQPYGKGLHIHWALPDALTRGRHTASPLDPNRKTAVFPAIPDRWLITRTGSINGQSANREFVVESDYLWPEEQQFEQIIPLKELIERAIRQMRSSVNLLAANPFDKSLLEARVDQLKNTLGKAKNFSLPGELDSQFDRIPVDTASVLSSLETGVTAFESAFTGNAATAKNALKALLQSLASTLENTLEEVIHRRTQCITYPILDGLLPNAHQSFRYMGRTVPVEAINNGTEYLNDISNYKLTAIGYGEPTFAAFYPNCRSVLGFYDPEVGPGDNVSYHICGWYRKLEDDFLNQLAQSGDDDLQTLLASKANWSAPGFDARPDSRMFCMAKLIFDGTNFNTIDRDFGNPTVTIANTAREALAARLAYEIVRPASEFNQIQELSAEIKVLDEQIEALENKKARFFLTEEEQAELDGLLRDRSTKKSTLNDLQNDADFQANISNNRTNRLKIEDQLEALFFAEQLDDRQLDIDAKFREMRHERGFNALSTGEYWTIRLERDAQQNAQEANEAERNWEPLPAAVAGTLHRLNAFQKAYDEKHFKIGSLRQQLFTDWYKYMMSIYPPQDSLIDYPDIDEIRYFVQEKDLKPLWELIVRAGSLQLDHPTKPGHASSELGLEATDAFQKLIRRELGVVFEIPEDWVKDLLAGFVPAGAAVSQLEITDIDDWPGLVAAFQEADPSQNIIKIKQSLPTAIRDRINKLDLGAGVVEEADQRAILNALQQFLLLSTSVAETLNRLLREIEQHNYHLSKFQVSDVLSWPGFFDLLGNTDDDPVIDQIISVLSEPIQTQIQEHRATRVTAINNGDDPPVLELVAADPEKLEIINQLNALLESRTLGRALIETALPGTIKPGFSGRYVLQRISGPRYWQPKEPTVLITGDLAQASERFGKDGRFNSGLLECKAQGISFSGSEISLLDSLNAIFDAVGFPFGVQTVAQNPWNPFLLEWEVEVCQILNGSNSQDRAYDPDYIRNNTLLKVNQTDLDINVETFLMGANPNLYNGRSLLTSGVQRKYSEQLQAYIDKQAITDVAHWAKKAKSALEDPTKLKGRVLAQSLSGFNPAMLMLKQTYQMPVAEPIGFKDYRDFTQLVAGLVGDTTKLSPQPLTNFTPIRAGQLRLNQLRVVDTFGQYQQLDFFDPDGGAQLFGSSLGAASLDGLDSRVLVELPPRLAQPARLHFRWLAAEAVVRDEINAEMNAHPATSPICGWLLTNHLDGSLMVFDKDGKSLGAIENEAAGNLAKWNPAPGLERLDNPENIANPHLKKMVAYLRARGDAFIPQFIDATDSVLRTIEPETFEHQQALALLMGRPIALVRASIDLELKGVPAVDHSWEAFYRDRTDGDNQRETDDYTKVKFPVRLGAVGQSNDGLIGYWVENADGTYREEKFYLNQLDTEMSGLSVTDDKIQFLEETVPIHQSLDVEDQPQVVSMLIDPRAKVHAFTGILPVKEIDIPTDQFLGAMQAIDITFLTAPILTPADKINLPISSEQGFEWSWVEQKGAAFDEIYTYPTIERSVFLDKFINLLWQQLIKQHWIVGTLANSTLAPVEERLPLSPEFNVLKSRLESELPASGPVTKTDLNWAGAQLWDEVLIDPAVSWIVPMNDGNALARILLKEDRVKNELETGIRNYRGLESRVEGILTRNHRAITPPQEGANFFSSHLWIREGWLKLQKI